MVELKLAAVMNLDTQISLITVPQEFTRLCNAALIAEHGDDFLPIDDDRPDRGNDGYLKSERRLFAVHCFKRAQNQGLDRAIQAKMIGDLGKAAALKREGLWDIEAWTFISNYPIAETTAARVVQVGREADIDVSWRGPDYLAGCIERHEGIREQFPNLYVTEIGDQLDQIQRAVGTLAEEPTAASLPPGGDVPTTDGEMQQLLVQKPDGWEYLLFAGALFLGKERLSLKWHDHEFAIPRGPREHIGVDAAPHYLDLAMDDLREIVDSMMRVFDPQAQELAFGSPGSPGDPTRIEHAALHIVNCYEELLDWAAALRSVRVPDNFVGVFTAAACFVDMPLAEIREFIDTTVTETKRIPAHLADPDLADEVLDIRLALILTIDDETVKRFNRELKRAKRRGLWLSVARQIGGVR